MGVTLVGLAVTVVVALPWLAVDRNPERESAPHVPPPVVRTVVHAERVHAPAHPLPARAAPRRAPSAAPRQSAR
ncbi:MAG TPA: hypothetical protein VK874_13770, partial [Gaiellaceae bacterium]|nr:hypothetical protein [Gaiellaceae bacterium]